MALRAAATDKRRIGEMKYSLGTIFSQTAGTALLWLFFFSDDYSEPPNAFRKTSRKQKSKSVQRQQWKCHTARYDMARL